jgi:hypothetical protein
MMAVFIENTDLKFTFRDKSKKNYKSIFSEERIDLRIEIPNASPYFVKEDSADYQGPLVVDKDGNMFDREFVDNSISVKVSQKFFRVIFLQDVLKQMFELLENNFLKKDDFTDHFETIIKNKRKVKPTTVEGSLLESVN